MKSSLDAVADKDPVVMWSRIADMADDAKKFEILAKVSLFVSKNFKPVFFSNFQKKLLNFF